MKNLYFKYAGGAILFAGLFYMTLVGKMSPTDFQTLAVSALGVLFGYHAGKGGNSTGGTPNA